MDTGLPTDDPGHPLFEIYANLCLKLDRIGDSLAQSQRSRDSLFGAVYPLDVPAQQGKVTAGGALVIASPELLGPRTGVYWDIRRVTVAGLASNSETVTLYKGSTGSSSDQVAQNAIAPIQPTVTTGTVGVYSPGLGGCLLRAGEKMSIGGAGLTASELITVSWSGVSIDAPWIGAYLL